MAIRVQDTDLLFGDVNKVADITGLSKSSLDKMRCYHPEKSPPFFRVGRRCLYPLAGLRDWVDTRLACASAGGR